VHEVYNGGGNPYGTSFTSDPHGGGPDEETLTVARAQGTRLASVARVIGSARDAGLLTGRRVVSGPATSNGQRAARDR
jgi:hypothetical protein